MAKRMSEWGQVFTFGIELFDIVFVFHGKTIKDRIQWRGVSCDLKRQREKAIYIDACTNLCACLP